MRSSAMLAAAGTALPLAGAVFSGAAAAASSSRNQRSYLDDGVTVSKARLDELAAKVHSLFNENSILNRFDAAKHGARFDVVLHRVTTHTSVPETGEIVKTSGLLAVPAGAKGRIPVVSWQHGTILSFDQVPSNLTRIAQGGYALRDNVDSMETLINVQRFAGNGYAVIAADYLGKGPYRDRRDEAYVVKNATVQTCIAVLEAGLKSLRSLGLARSHLFLNGWSQGSLNTQWLRQELQRRATHIMATAVESPFNDLNEAFRFWAGADSFTQPSDAPYPKQPDWLSLCMIVALGSYQRYYRLDGLLKAAIKPDYHELAARFWSRLFAELRLIKIFSSTLKSPHRRVFRPLYV